MKKILSKVLIAISIFNGVNVSTGAMEEQTVNPSTGVSNSWKDWAKKERKRITDFVDWMIQNEWNNCRHFRVDLGESREEMRRIDKQVAVNTTKTRISDNVLIPNLYACWQSAGDYDEWLEEDSWPYLFYGRGMCRNRAAWVCRNFIRNLIFAHIVLLSSPDEPGIPGALNHTVVLYAMPDENCENKWNYYIADLMRLKSEVAYAVCSQMRVQFSLPEDGLKSVRDAYMQIPLERYLNSEEQWCGVGYIVGFIYGGPSLLRAQSNKMYKQVADNSELEKEWNSATTKKQREDCIKRNEDRLKKYCEMNDKFIQNARNNDPLTLACSCENGAMTKDEASKRGVIDLTMWCQKNCPEVLKKTGQNLSKDSMNDLKNSHA